MDFKKANLEICRSIADDKNICGGWTQIGGVKYFFMSIVNRENEVFYTKTLMQCSAYRNKIVRKFVPLTGNKEVYIDVNFLKCLDLDVCHFYQDKNDPKSKLIVTEHNTPVMIVCPMIYTEGD